MPSGERVKAMFAKVRLWWRPLCEVEGCDRPAGYFRMCDECLDEDQRRWAREQAHQKFEREVAVHLEALRRHDAEKVAAESEDGVS